MGRAWVPVDGSHAWGRAASPQNLLIITAIKSDKSRVKDYVHRLDNFDGPAVGEIAVGYEMFEEAFEIYKKFELKVRTLHVRWIAQRRAAVSAYQSDQVADLLL